MVTSFDIREYGAVSDGKTINTVAIQKAIDACHHAGGRVFCGPGEYVTGTLDLRSGVELHLASGCRIIGSPHLEDYRPLRAVGFRHEGAPEGTADYLLGAAHAENIAITGLGEINANGEAFYDQTKGLNSGGRFACGKPKRRPRLGMFYKCRNLRLEDVTFRNAPCWTFWLMQCDGVNVHRIKIFADKRMYNVDGIDIDACRRVMVSDCQIDTEDDSIVLRAIQSVYDEPAICEQVVVSNCVLASRCQGVRIGCPNDGVIRDCLFNNLLITSSGNGIVFNNPRRYFCAEGGQAADISGIAFNGCYINCRGYPVSIDVEAGIALKRLADLRFAGFYGCAGAPLRICGSRETIIRNVRFTDFDMNIQAADGIICRNCAAVVFANFKISNLPEGCANLPALV